MQQKHFSIAIDGPAGAGKSTIAKSLAKRLGIMHLDTGAMYRAAGKKALDHGIDPVDRGKVAPMIAATDIDVVFSSGVQRVFLDGADVTDKIRTQDVSKAASDIGTIPEVRVKLVELQRGIAERNSIIMDGRDIGSYVLPDAEFKFYITADVKERARRRMFDLRRFGTDEGRTYEDIEREIADRDRVDSTREFAPLKMADDAILIDTTNMTAEAVIDLILVTIGR